MYALVNKGITDRIFKRKDILIIGDSLFDVGGEYFTKIIRVY